MNTTESTRYADFEWATRLNRVTLNFIGIWPHAHKNDCNKILSDLRTMIAFAFTFFIGIPMLHALVRTWGDMMATIDNLQYILPLFITTLKLVVVWWKKTDLTLLINMITEDWIKVKTDKELRVMIKRAQYSRALAIVGYVTMFLSIIIGAILPIFGISVRYITNITDPGRPLIFQAYYLFDTDRSPNYELTYAAQVYMSVIIAATYTGIDNLFGLLVFHLCGQMENLKEKLINMKAFTTFNDSLAIIVKDHIRLIKCFDIIESTYTILLLGLLLYFGILFCLCGFLITAVLSESTKAKELSFGRLLFNFMVLLNFGCHTCLFCAVGEILVAQCEDIHRAAYEYEWYKLKPNDAKTLILIMIRTSKPLYITAGKMFHMTMSTFCNLIKTSAGYVSVLLAAQRTDD